MQGEIQLCTICNEHKLNIKHIFFNSIYLLAKCCEPVGNPDWQIIKHEPSISLSRVVRGLSAGLWDQFKILAV